MTWAMRAWARDEKKVDVHVDSDLGEGPREEVDEWRYVERGSPAWSARAEYSATDCDEFLIERKLSLKGGTQHVCVKEERVEGYFSRCH